MARRDGRSVPIGGRPLAGGDLLRLLSHYFALFRSLIMVTDLTINPTVNALRK